MSISISVHLNKIYSNVMSVKISTVALLVCQISILFHFCCSLHWCYFDIIPVLGKLHISVSLQTCFIETISGVKKLLVLVPGTSWISGRTSIYFHTKSCGQVKNSHIVYFSLTRTSHLVTGQVKILMYLPGGQVKFFRFFYPWIWKFWI